MIEWEDITSHSKGEKDRTPRTWKLTVASCLTIVVTRHTQYESHDWIMRCEPWFSCHLLTSTRIEDAKREAAQKVFMKLELAAEQLKNLM